MSHGIVFEKSNSDSVFLQKELFLNVRQGLRSLGVDTEAWQTHINSSPLNDKNLTTLFVDDWAHLSTLCHAQ